MAVSLQAPRPRARRRWRRTATRPEEEQQQPQQQPSAPGPLHSPPAWFPALVVVASPQPPSPFRRRPPPPPRAPLPLLRTCLCLLLLAFSAVSRREATRAKGLRERCGEAATLGSAPRRWLLQLRCFAAVRRTLIAAPLAALVARAAAASGFSPAAALASLGCAALWWLAHCRPLVVPLPAAFLLLQLAELFGVTWWPFVSLISSSLAALPLASPLARWACAFSYLFGAALSPHAAAFEDAEAALRYLIHCSKRGTRAVGWLRGRARRLAGWLGWPARRRRGPGRGAAAAGGPTSGPRAAALRRRLRRAYYVPSDLDPTPGLVGGGEGGSGEEGDEWEGDGEGGGDGEAGGEGG